MTNGRRTGGTPRESAEAPVEAPAQPAVEPPTDAPATGRRRPRGAVRDGLIAAGVELARTGGPDAVVLREATRIVGVVPNAAYRHFADRDELLAAVCNAAMRELGERMAAEVAQVPGEHGDPTAAMLRLAGIGSAYLRFAREEPGLFATAFAVPQQHAYVGAGTGSIAGSTGTRGESGPAADGAETGVDAAGPTPASAPAPAPDRSPLGQLRAALDELVDAGVLDSQRRDGIEFPIWSTVHGLAVLAGQGPLRNVPDVHRRRLEDLTLTFIANSLG